MIVINTLLTSKYASYTIIYMIDGSKIKPKDVYNVKEVAEIFSTTVPTVRNHIKKKTLAASQVGREYRITGQAVLEFLHLE